MTTPDNFTNDFNNASSMFNIMSVIVPIFIFIVFVFVILSIVSPKFRSKLMGLQIKAIKHTVADNKADLVDIGTNMGDVAAQTASNVVDRNEGKLKNVATKGANISKEGVEITAAAVKKGFSSDTGDKESMSCKSCDAKIDKDSAFCRECGKKV